MRKYLSLSCLFILFTVHAGSVAQQSRTSKSSTASLDEQANQQAHAFWDARITRCGDDYYTQERNYIHQFRTPRIEVRSQPLSTANRLNGLEYDGFTRFQPSQSRTYSPKAALYQSAGWSAWSEGFTATMGGMDLNATIQKSNGRWRVVPSSVSQSGILRSINCSDALNPVEYFRSLAKAAENADVAEFRRIATSGILLRFYSSNLPSDMWQALAKFGLNRSSGGYISLRDVYLAPNGGWSVWRERSSGTWGDFPVDISEKISAGYEVETISPEGGWFLWGTQYQSRQRTGSYLTKGLPDWLVNKIAEIHANRNLQIEKIRVGSNGLGVLLYNNVSASGQAWWADGVMLEVLNQLWKEGKVNGSNKTIRDIAFTPEGGYVVIYDRNGYIFDGVPDDLRSALAELNRCGFSIDRVTIGPLGSWAVLGTAFTPIRCPPVSSINNENDLSGTYGMVGNIIFNKKTMVVFVTPAEFFRDSGKSSFDGLQYDRMTSLPQGLRFADGRKLTAADYRGLQPR